jgi:hypothetical protein
LGFTQGYTYGFFGRDVTLSFHAAFDA